MTLLLILEDLVQFEAALAGEAVPACKEKSKRSISARLRETRKELNQLVSRERFRQQHRGSDCSAWTN